MIDGHECNAYCAGDEHCELVWSSFDHEPSRRFVHDPAAQEPPHESVRRHYDAAYRRHYDARVTRTAPAREPLPRESVAPEEETPLVGSPGDGDHYAWLVWFIPPGPAADAYAAAEQADWQAKLAALRGHEREKQTR